MNPPTSNPRSQALARAQVFRDDWEECREDPVHAPGKAWSLLAAWGAVCRFFAPEASQEAAALSLLIEQDAPALLQALAQAPEPGEWIERARGLDGAWDFATREETVRELEDAAVTLFDELDRHSLAVCMAQRLAPDGAQAEPWNGWQQQVERAEDYFRDHVEAFLPAAPLAGAVFAVCREGLEEDEALWRTVLKHRLLEETAEELAAAPMFLRRERGALRPVWDKVTLAGRQTVHLPEVVSQPWLGYSQPWPEYSGVAAGPLATNLASYECRDPQGEYTALFDLAHPDQQPEVVVTFYREGHRAENLKGTAVRLRGVPSPDGIDGRGRARFPRALLDTQSGPLRLEVGDPPVAWPFRTESSHDPFRPVSLVSPVA